MIFVIILYALLALTFIIAKEAVFYAHPLFIIAVRMSLAGAILLSLWLKNNTFHKLKKALIKDHFDFAQVIIFHIYCAFIFEFLALGCLPSIKVNIMYATTPFIIVILAALLFKERFSLQQIFGVLVGFQGILPLLLTKSPWCWHEFFSFAKPDILLWLAIISAAYAWFVVKRLLDKGYALFLINGIGMLGGGILSFITWKFMGNGQPVLAWGPFFLTVSLLILISNVIVYNLYGWLLKKYSLSFVSCAGFLCPVFGAIYSYFLLHEPLNWYHGWAIISIAAGLYLFYYSD